MIEIGDTAVVTACEQHDLLTTRPNVCECRLKGMLVRVRVLSPTYYRWNVVAAPLSDGELTEKDTYYFNESQLTVVKNHEGNV